MPKEVGAQSPSTVDPNVWEEQHGKEEEDAGANEAASLTFSLPEALLRPPPANPLRIFVSFVIIYQY